MLSFLKVQAEISASKINTFQTKTQPNGVPSGGFVWIFLGKLYLSLGKDLLLNHPYLYCRFHVGMQLDGNLVDTKSL